MSVSAVISFGGLTSNTGTGASGLFGVGDIFKGACVNQVRIQSYSLYLQSCDRCLPVQA
jgi:hypothetical protein